MLFLSRATWRPERSRPIAQVYCSSSGTESEDEDEGQNELHEMELALYLAKLPIVIGVFW